MLQTLLHGLQQNFLIRIVLLLLLGAPVALSLIYLLVYSGAPLFWDGMTLSCGLDAFINGSAPNAYLDPDYGGRCAGYGFQYMHPPGITYLLASISGVISLQGLIYLYITLFIISVWLLLYVGNQYRQHWPVVIGLTIFMGCGALLMEFFGGNVAALFVGFIVGTMVVIERYPWAIIIVSVLTALFKPHLALYLLVPLAAGVGPAWVIAGVAFVALWYAVDLAWHRQEFMEWLSFVMPISYFDRSFGSLRIGQEFGVGLSGTLLQIMISGSWFLLMMGGLYKLRQRFSHPIDIAFVALLCVTLSLPRLKEYDSLVVLPIIFWTLSKLSLEVGRRYVWALFLGLFLLPALWWWGRKVLLYFSNSSPEWMLVADLQWLYRTQGWVLVFALLLSMLTLFSLQLVRVPEKNHEGRLPDDMKKSSIT